jgi:hypothetical protein
MWWVGQHVLPRPILRSCLAQSAYSGGIAMSARHIVHPLELHNPAPADQRFRWMSSTDSGLCRPPVPAGWRPLSQTPKSLAALIRIMHPECGFSDYPSHPSRAICWTISSHSPSSVLTIHPAHPRLIATSTSGPHAGILLPSAPSRPTPPANAWAHLPWGTNHRLSPKVAPVITESAPP